MDYDLKKLQEVQLDIAKELKRVCEKNGIEYFLVYGTCLGAIRHKGFIPWDDDIDIGMTVDNFQKLLNSKNDFKSEYFLQCNETDKEYGLAIGRLRKNNTTLIEKEEDHRDINHGIFVDIYPFYNMPQRRFSQKKLIFISMIYRLMLYESVPKNRGKLMKIGSRILLGITPKFLRRKIVKKTKSILDNSKETGLYSPLYGGMERRVVKKEVLFPIRNEPFEKEILPVPARAEQYLSDIYGNYMELPPEEKRKVHHDFKYIDFENSYLLFKGKLYCEKRNK